MGKDEPRETDRREERDPDGLLPSRIVEIVEAPGWGTACVGYEDVDRPEFVDGGLHKLVAARLRPDVRDGPLHVRSGLALHVLGGGADRSFVTAAHDHPRALAREFLGDRASESLAGRGDDGDFVAESEIHGAIVPPCGGTSLGSAGSYSPPPSPISPSGSCGIPRSACPSSRRRPRT